MMLGHNVLGATLRTESCTGLGHEPSGNSSQLEASCNMVSIELPLDM